MLYLEWNILVTGKSSIDFFIIFNKEKTPVAVGSES